MQNLRLITIRLTSNYLTPHTTLGDSKIIKSICKNYNQNNCDKINKLTLFKLNFILSTFICFIVL